MPSFQRFFRHICMSAKVPAAVRLAKQALADGMCVVIGLQSTGEARTEEAVTKYVGSHHPSPDSWVNLGHSLELQISPKFVS